jgi:F-type H+-transporting ATPase subunit epsilon
MPAIQCIIVTPEETLRDTPADFVALTLYDGEIGIGHGHTPMIGRLGAGEMRIVHAGQTEHFYIEGGFVEVLDDVVSVLTGRAVPVSELDEIAAMDQLESARNRPANTPELMALRDEEIQRCRAQIRLARRATF